MDVTYKNFNSFSATKDDWKKVHSYRKKYHDENTPDEPFLDDPTFEKMIKAEMNFDEIIVSVHTIHKDNDELIGLYFTQQFKEESPSYKGNENVMQYRIELDKNYRYKGIGTQVLKRIAQKAKEDKKSVLITNSSEQDGKGFLNRIGADIGLAGRENRLYFKDVDWAMVKKWKNEGEKYNPLTKLLIFNRVPDELLENYCKTFTFAGNQAPRDNLAVGDFIMHPKLYRKQEEENNKVGVVPEIAATVEPDGTVSGLTELKFIKTDDKILRQSLTAVLKEYRGRKIGKWLKASLLLHAKEKYPSIEFIITGNAESNGPMLSINERLGFKKYKEMIVSQISLEKLQSYLDSKTNDLPVHSFVI